MNIISIANAKGGTGKTTLAVNLAYEIQRHGYKVLMIDLDSQCDLTKVYRPSDHEGPTIFDVLQKKCKISNAMVSVMDNLFLIPGSKDIAHFNFKGSENTLLRYLRTLKKIDFVIIDHPPNLHEAALAGFVASNEVLIVSDPETFSIQNLGQLLEDLDNIKATNAT